MVQNKNNILKFKPKPKPLKYYICEFFKRYGEDENTYHYIFSNRCSDIIKDYDEEYKQSIEELWDEQGRNEDKTYEKQDS